MNDDGVERVTVITQQDDTDRKDSGENYLYIVLFYLLGTVSFIPHSIYIQANEYWMYKFRDANLQFNESDAAEKTTLQQNFTSFATVSCNIGLFLFIFLTAGILRHKIAIQTRIIGGMTLLLVFFMVTVVFIFVDTDTWQPGFFAVALLIGGLLNACSGILLISLFQLTSQFHPRCLAALFAGQSVCGILAAVIQIVALLVGSTVKSTAALYYFVAIAMIAFMMIAYMLVCIRSSDFHARLKRLTKKGEKSEKKKKRRFELDKIKRVLRKLRLRLAALLLTVCTSHILHPGFTSLIESSGKGTNVWSDTYFLPVCVFFLYYTFEFIAREGSNYFMVLKNRQLILGTSIVRMALIPLILLCNIRPRHVLPVIFHDDTYFIVFIILLGLSAGYLVNIIIVIHGDNFNKEEELISKIIIALSLIIVMSLSSIMSGIFVNFI